MTRSSTLVLIKQQNLNLYQNHKNMKRIFISLFAVMAFACSAVAQKYALVDMEYILSNIPDYERANEQLNQVSKRWQAEVEAIDDAAKALYKNYQNELIFLSEQQKKDREEAIITKEKEASELRRKYFGPEGELYKMRVSLIEPIQEEIYNAVKALAQQKGYQLVLDRASDNGIIFASPSIDISVDVLAKLGYNK
jgi:outer membrane protein